MKAGEHPILWAPDRHWLAKPHLQQQKGSAKFPMWFLSFLIFKAVLYPTLPHRPQGGWWDHTDHNDFIVSGCCTMMLCFSHNVWAQFYHRACPKTRALPLRGEVTSAWCHHIENITCSNSDLPPLLESSLSPPACVTIPPTTVIALDSSMILCRDLRLEIGNAGNWG